jgi:hypothetical protein
VLLASVFLGAYDNFRTNGPIFFCGSIKRRDIGPSLRPTTPSFIIPSFSPPCLLPGSMMVVSARALKITPAFGRKTPAKKPKSTQIPALRIIRTS